ncbi:carbohydrate ABC transporter permease [Vallitalea sediminicola]
MSKIGSNKSKRLTIEILKVVVLFCFGLVMMGPFIWMVSVSFERMANIQPPFPPRLFPKEFSFFNYKIILENGSLLRSYMNSFIVALGSVALNIFSALLAGYAFSKGVFKGKKILFVIILTTMMIPGEITLIPMYMMFNKVGLLNTFYPIIFPSLLFGFGIILTKQYFDKLPNSLREAAQIDGASEVRTFTQIFLPLTGPISATLIILSFMRSWNSFIWPMIVLSDQKLQTVPIYLASFSMEDGTRYAGLTMGLATASILPVVLVFLFLQKYIIQSVALSGLKGE